MPVKSVRVKINNVWSILNYNPKTGKYEGEVTAPSSTSYNLNEEHYYPVTIEAVDMAGNIVLKDNTDEETGKLLKLRVRETTKPVITILNPSNGAYVTNSSQEISFKLRDELGGSGIKLSSLKLQIDNENIMTNTSLGVNVTTVAGGYDILYSPQTIFKDGKHTIKIDVEDNDGNFAVSTESSFIVDTVPPALNITKPASDGSYVNRKLFLIEGKTSDATSSPVGINITLNNLDVGAVSIRADGSFDKEVTLVEGNNAINIIATDKAGKSSSIKRTIICDIVPPVISEILITPNPVNVSDKYTISVKVVD